MTAEESLKPLFKEAREKGLLFYSKSLAGEFWFTLDELEKLNSNGRFLWGAVNWRLRELSEMTDQMDLAIKDTEYKLNELRVLRSKY